MCRERKARTLGVPAALAIVLLLGLAAAPALAQVDAGGQTFPAGTFRDGTLNARVTGPTDFTFTGPTGNETLTFHVVNDRNSRMDVLLLLQQEDQWVEIDRLGSLGPGQAADFSYEASFSYGGKANETDTFALMGDFGLSHTGRTFTVREDWTAYERSLKNTLSIVGVPLAIALLIILAIVMAGTIAAAMRTRYTADGEYTFRTLFFPMARARPVLEKIADVIITPFFWIVELLIGSMLIGLILAIGLGGVRPDIGVLIFFVGGVAALFMPLIFLVITWLADYYSREPFRFIVAMFMWGVMATLFAFFINTTTLSLVELFVSSGMGLVIAAVLVAPVVEETVKGLGLLILSGHHEYDSTFDGILFGFAVGMGFAAVENWLYFVVRYSPITAGGLIPWTYLILYRSFLGSLSHGCFTAATGGVIGYFKSRPDLKRHTLIAFLIGLPIAMFLHGLGNFTVIVGSVVESAVGLPVPVFDPLYTIVLTTIYIILGAVLQLRIKDRLMRRGPKPEG